VSARWPCKILCRKLLISCALEYLLPVPPLLILSNSHRVWHLHLFLHQQHTSMLLLRVYRLHILLPRCVQPGHRYLARRIRVHPFTRPNQCHPKSCILPSFLLHMQTCRRVDRTLIHSPILSPLPFFPLSRVSRLWALLCLSVTSHLTRSRRECLGIIHLQDRRDMCHRHPM
jgi:hypothetical protein